MKKKRYSFRTVAERIVRSSAKPPQSLEEVCANAVAEHWKEHIRDGNSRASRST
jgi:hypothetical protein